MVKLSKNDIKPNIRWVPWRSCEIFLNKLKVLKAFRKAAAMSLNFKKVNKKIIWVQVHKTSGIKYFNH